jgi:hypothetical protein
MEKLVTIEDLRKFIEKEVKIAIINALTEAVRNSTRTAFDDEGDGFDTINANILIFNLQRIIEE